MKASKVIEQAKSWLGKNEKDGSHKEIIDLYNSRKPLPRGYKVKYTDEWCATYVSAVFMKLGYDYDYPVECSCGKMIELAVEKGIWREDDTYVPRTADIILYDWGDSSNYATTDNKGWPKHIGIVTDVKNGKITIIEGNLNNKVDYREIAVNGRYIRGYICPIYKAEQKNTEPNKSYVDIKLEKLEKGSTGDAVKALQTLLVNYGYGSFVPDAVFGDKTLKAVKAFQEKNGIGADGIVGIKTWNKLLGTN